MSWFDVAEAPGGRTYSIAAYRAGTSTALTGGVPVGPPGERPLSTDQDRAMGPRARATAVTGDHAVGAANYQSSLCLDRLDVELGDRGTELRGEVVELRRCCS